MALLGIVGYIKWGLYRDHRVYIGVIWDYRVCIRIIIGIMEKNMETTVMGYI